MTEATRLITPPDAHKPSFAPMREEYVAACNGDSCMAALLALFENWTLYRRAQGYEDWAWVTMSVEEMVFGLYGQFSASTIEGRLPLLTALLYLERRKPAQKTTDRRWQYRFDTDTVQLAVDTLFSPDALAEMTECISQNQGMHPADLPNGMGENTECNEQNSGMHSAENANALAETGEPDLLDSYKESCLESGAKHSSSSSPVDGAPADDDEDSASITPPLLEISSTDQQHWNAAFHQLEMQLDRASFETHLRGAVLLAVERADTVAPGGAAIFRVAVRHQFAQSTCQHRLYRNIHRVLSDVSGMALGVLLLRFEVTASADDTQDGADAVMPLYALLQPPTDAAREPEPEPEYTPAEVYRKFAEEIQEITPMVQDFLVDAVAELGAAAVVKAIKAAADHNARNLAYVKVCLYGKPASRGYQPARQVTAFVRT